MTVRSHSGTRSLGLHLAFGCAALLAAAARPGFAGTAHATTALAYEEAVYPEHNAYGSPSTLSWDGAGELHATTVCGGYAGLLLRNTYATVTTTVLRALTGSTSPNSKQWNDAIDGAATYSGSAGTFRFVARGSIDDVARGDLLASEYVTAAGATGHTMVVEDTWLDAPSVATTIPGVPLAERWLVQVHDSTSSPHGTSDSRWHADADGTHDQGIGSGYIYLYADQDTGAIIGWTWSTSSSSSYQGTDPTAAAYRPMAAGTLTGPGL